MMNVSLYGLVLMFVVLTIFLLSLNLRSNWHWGVKSIAIVASLFFWIVCYNSLSSFAGAPIQHVGVPDRFEFLWSHEIVPSRDEDGVIYMWVIPEGSTEPHNYRLEYSTRLHRQLLKQKERICKGEKLFGRRGQDRLRQDGQDGGQRSPSHHQGFDFRSPVDLLPPKSPPK